MSFAAVDFAPKDPRDQRKSRKFTGLTLHSRNVPEMISSPFLLHDV